MSSPLVNTAYGALAVVEGVAALGLMFLMAIDGVRLPKISKAGLFVATIGIFDQVIRTIVQIATDVPMQDHYFQIWTLKDAGFALIVAGLFFRCLKRYRGLSDKWHHKDIDD